MSPDLTRPRPPFPYDLLPPLPSFTLESEDVAEGERIADRFTAPDENISPELHWSGFPRATRSFVVSCFDPDAPTPSGWWHWTVQDLDVSVTSLPRGAGESDLRLEGAAFHAATDSGSHAWFGPYPPCTPWTWTPGAWTTRPPRRRSPSTARRTASPAPRSPRPTRAPAPPAPRPSCRSRGEPCEPCEHRRHRPQ